MQRKRSGLGSKGGGGEGISARLDSTSYTVGNKATFGGFVNMCIWSGTTGVGVPAIIAPVGRTELIANGDMSDISDVVYVDGTGAIVNGRLEITDAGPSNGRGAKPFAAVNGHSYLLGADCFPSLGVPTPTNGGIRASSSTGLTNDSGLQVIPILTDQRAEGIMTASATQTYYLTMIGDTLVGSTYHFDNASSVEVTKDDSCYWVTIGYA